MMRLSIRLLGVVAALGLSAGPALAQKSGGTLKMYVADNPPSTSIHEEATTSTVVPFMGLYNNLVVFDSQIPQNSMETIRPDLAESWSWSPDGKKLTFKLVGNAKWHDGKPFTSADVKCTWDMLTGKSETQKLRKNPRTSWYWNLNEVTTNGDREVTFHLGQPQPSMLILLASGYSPVYSCHVPTAQMRTKPIGTGPFKLGEFKQKEIIKLVRNPDYFKKGKPYLDAVEMPIVPARGTAILGFVSGRYDMTAPYAVTIPLLKDVKAQAADAICEVAPMNNNTNLIVNSVAPPFDNADIRRAMLLTIDRKSFIDILAQGYGPDVAKNRAEAQAIMKKAGYGPDNRLKLKVSTRNHLLYRDPAVILIDQLKEIYIDGELDLVDTALWFNKVARKDYSIGLNTTGNGVDDPDQTYFEHYACKSERNYVGYCNPEIEKLFPIQSAERDMEKRKKLVWEIDKQILEEGFRPIVMWNVSGSCWHPHVKGFRPMVNSLYNGSRFEDVWLDK